MSTRNSILAFVSRLIVGGVFINAGWMKISDMASTIGSFAAMNIPTWLTYIVSYGEFIAGILIVAGVLYNVSIRFLTIVMIVAVYLTLPMGSAVFVTPLITLGALLALCASGAGKFALSFKK
jgi:uncharacterized membrane protein YphA (DoxX/SURF4 family)